MFRFTIRDVLWLMVVVAVGLGIWSTERRKLVRERESLHKERETLAIRRREVEEAKRKVAEDMNLVGRLHLGMARREAALVDTQTADAPNKD